MVAIDGARCSSHVFVVYKVRTLKTSCIVNGPTDPNHYQIYIECGVFFTITLYRLSLIVTVALVLGALLSFFNGSLIIRKLIKGIFIFSNFSKQ
jgi:hypothetical protein